MIDERELWPFFVASPHPASGGGNYEVYVRLHAEPDLAGVHQWLADAFERVQWADPGRGWVGAPREDLPTSPKAPR